MLTFMSTYDVGFGQPLDAVLEQQADAVGETVQSYIRRVVAERLIEDMGQRADPLVATLRQQFADIGVEVGDYRADHGRSIIDDPRRLSALSDTGLLDAAPDPALHRIVLMAAEALGVRSAALILLDRERLFFASAVGVGEDIAVARELPLGASIGQFVVEAEHTLIIDDATAHPALANLSFVTDGSIVGYMGIPLRDPDGYVLGSLAVWDSAPRAWGTGHVETLHNFARMAWLRIFGEQDA